MARNKRRKLRLTAGAASAAYRHGGMAIGKASMAASSAYGAAKNQQRSEGM